MAISVSVSLYITVVAQAFRTIFANPQLISNEMVKSTCDSLTRCLVLSNLLSEIFQTTPSSSTMGVSP